MARIITVVTCIVLLVILGVNFYWDYLTVHSQPEIVMVTSTPTLAASDSTKTPFQPVAPTMTSTATLVPTLIPTATPFPVQQYKLGNAIDLGSGDPVVLVMRFPDGRELASNWASAIAYNGVDKAEDVFAPGSGTIYSYIGDMTSTWAHSGVYRGTKIFASNLELFLRVQPDGKLYTFAEGEGLMLEMVGNTAYLCQMPDGSVKALDDYNVQGSCLGNRLELVVTAAVIVPHGMVESYDEATMTTREWLIKNIPGAGFDKVSAENGWLLKFCVGEFNDQPVDGTPSYLYNRAVIGFTIVESGR